MLWHQSISSAYIRQQWKFRKKLHIQYKYYMYPKTMLKGDLFKDLLQGFGSI